MKGFGLVRVVTMMRYRTRAISALRRFEAAIPSIDLMGNDLGLCGLTSVAFAAKTEVYEALTTGAIIALDRER
jgi:hypothetical protein